MDTSAHLYLSRSDPEDCKCDVHDLGNKRARYKQLADKKCRLQKELIKVNREMTNLTSLMLDSACDIDETMKNLYKIDYEKRGLHVAQYRSLMAAVKSPMESLIVPTINFS